MYRLSISASFHLDSDCLTVKTTQASLMPSQPWVPLVLPRSNTNYQALNSSDTYTSFASVVLSEALAPTATRH